MQMDIKIHCEYLNKKIMPLFKKLGDIARANWSLRNKILSIINKGMFIPTIAYTAIGWTEEERSQNS